MAKRGGDFDAPVITTMRGGPSAPKPSKIDLFLGVGTDNEVQLADTPGEARKIYQQMRAVEARVDGLMPKGYVQTMKEGAIKIPAGIQKQAEEIGLNLSGNSSGITMRIDYDRYPNSGPSQGWLSDIAIAVQPVVPGRGGDDDTTTAKSGQVPGHNAGEDDDIGDESVKPRRRGRPRGTGGPTKYQAPATLTGTAEQSCHLRIETAIKDNDYRILRERDLVVFGGHEGIRNTVFSHVATVCNQRRILPSTSGLNQLVVPEQTELGDDSLRISGRVVNYVVAKAPFAELTFHQDMSDQDFLAFMQKNERYFSKRRADGNLHGGLLAFSAHVGDWIIGVAEKLEGLGDAVPGTLEFTESLGVDVETTMWALRHAKGFGYQCVYNADTFSLLRVPEGAVIPDPDISNPLAGHGKKSLGSGPSGNPADLGGHSEASCHARIDKAIAENDFRILKRNDLDTYGDYKGVRNAVFAHVDRWANRTESLPIASNLAEAAHGPDDEIEKGALLINKPVINYISEFNPCTGLSYQKNMNWEQFLGHMRTHQKAFTYRRRHATLPKGWKSFDERVKQGLEKVSGMLAKRDYSGVGMAGRMRVSVENMMWLMQQADRFGYSAVYTFDEVSLSHDGTRANEPKVKDPRVAPKKRGRRAPPDPSDVADTVAAAGPDAPGANDVVHARIDTAVKKTDFRLISLSDVMSFGDHGNLTHEIYTHVDNWCNEKGLLPTKPNLIQGVEHCPAKARKNHLRISNPLIGYVSEHSPFSGINFYENWALDDLLTLARENGVWFAQRRRHGSMRPSFQRVLDKVEQFLYDLREATREYEYTTDGICDDFEVSAESMQWASRYANSNGWKVNYGRGPVEFSKKGKRPTLKAVA